MEEKTLYDSVAISKLIPHRYPFLLVDKIVEFVNNERAVAVKCVTVNEPFFQGHFPGRPVMPGVLIVEALAQVGAILARISSDGVPDGKTIFLVGLDEMKFRRQVLPGDTLRLEMVFQKRRKPLWLMKGTATVDGKIVCEGNITAAEAD